MGTGLVRERCRLRPVDVMPPDHVIIETANLATYLLEIEDKKLRRGLSIFGRLSLVAPGADRPESHCDRRGDGQCAALLLSPSLRVGHNAVFLDMTAGDSALYATPPPTFALQPVTRLRVERCGIT